MASDPDALARLVHDTRLAHEADRAATEGRVLFSLGTWGGRAEHQRELDRRIASAVAAQAVADAKLDMDRMRAQLFALGAHLPAIRKALSVAVADAPYSAQAAPYRAALQALSGDEEK